jgi:hypothetical protein
MLFGEPLQGESPVLAIPRELLVGSDEEALGTGGLFGRQFREPLARVTHNLTQGLATLPRLFVIAAESPQRVASGNKRVRYPSWRGVRDAAHDVQHPVEVLGAREKTHGLRRVRFTSGRLSRTLSQPGPGRD